MINKKTAATGHSRRPSENIENIKGDIFVESSCLCPHFVDLYLGSTLLFKTAVWNNFAVQKYKIDSIFQNIFQ